MNTLVQRRDELLAQRTALWRPSRWKPNTPEGEQAFRNHMRYRTLSKEIYKLNAAIKLLQP